MLEEKEQGTVGTLRNSRDSRLLTEIQSRDSSALRFIDNKLHIQKEI